MPELMVGRILENEAKRAAACLYYFLVAG